MVDTQLVLEDLMHQSLPLAKQMLQDDGVFVPFGAVMGADGDVTPVGVAIDQPGLKAKDVVDILHDNMIDMAQTGAYSATAVFYAVQVSLPGTDTLTDAVAVNLSHVTGDAITVFHPFNRAAGGIHYGSAFAYMDENRIFRRCH